MSGIVQAWAPPLGHAEYITGRYYWPQYGSVGTGTVSLTANEIGAMPFFIAKDATFDRILCEVTTAGAAGALIRLAIYTHDFSSGRPGSLVLDAGTVATTSIGVKEITISQLLQRGYYWFANQVNIAATFRNVTTNGACGQLNMGFNTSDPADGSGLATVLSNIAFAFGPFPSTFPAGGVPSNSNNEPRIGLRAA
jgi:hypothetical protein